MSKSSCLCRAEEIILLSRCYCCRFVSFILPFNSCGSILLFSIGKQKFNCRIVERRRHKISLINDFHLAFGENADSRDNFPIKCESTWICAAAGAQCVKVALRICFSHTDTLWAGELLRGYSIFSMFAYNPARTRVPQWVSGCSVMALINTSRGTTARFPYVFFVNEMRGQCGLFCAHAANSILIFIAARPSHAT